MTEGISLGSVSVAIGMPVGKPIPYQTVSSIFATAFVLGQMNIRCDLLMQICGVVQIARDSVLDEFLKGKADKLFWIDSDMAWEPKDFLRLLALSMEHDVVAAAYPHRSGETNLFQVNTDGIETPVVNKYGLRAVNGLGLGFCIVDRKACELLAGKAPRVMDGWSKREMAEVFRVDRSAKGYRRTEDIAFFDDLREAGFTVWCDPSIELGHIGEREWRGRLIDASDGAKPTPKEN
jgi:hypothetical protein